MRARRSNPSAHFEAAANAVAGEEAAAAFNVFAPEAPPPPGASEDFLFHIQFWREYEREVFANALETARIVYAFRPDLVTAPHWPADVKAVFMANNDYDPELEQHLSIGEDSFSSDYEKWVLSQADKSVRKEEQARRVVCIDRSPVRTETR